MKKMVIKVIALSFILSIFFNNNGMVNAIEDQRLYDEGILKVKDFFNQYGVNESTQNELINTINSGQLLDSMKEDTVAISTYEVNNNNVIETVAVYQDGSISVTGVELPNEKFIENDYITPFAIEGGSSSSGSGYATYKNVRVYHNTGTINAQFQADYTLTNGKSFISDVYDEKVLVILGNHSNIDLRIVRKTENLDNLAEAKLSFDYKYWTGIASGNAFLQLYVGNNKAYTKHSW